MRVVVADTGPVLHLTEAGAEDLLRQSGEVHIPEFVDREISHLHDNWRAARPFWVQVTALEPAYSAEALAWVQAGLLDRGEAEAIGLTRQLSASWFLTDDASARLVAQSLLWLSERVLAEAREALSVFCLNPEGTSGPPER